MTRNSERSITMKYILKFQTALITFFIYILSYSLVHAAEPKTIPLWPDGPPDHAVVHGKAEAVVNRQSDRNELGLNRAISFVSNPTMIAYPAPREKATGVAVIIFPGGGYRHLAIDKEGHDIARRLNKMGLSAFVVKYRTLPETVQGSGMDMPDKIMQAILSDGQRAIRLVRSRAGEWGIDAHKIGVMGFSAGGHLAASTATIYNSGNPNAKDPAAKASSRPDFACLIYPAMPRGIENKVTADTPPVFMVETDDDKTTHAEGDILLYTALRKAKIPAELHIFVHGGHGFGLGVRGGSVTRWPELFEEWLQEMRIIIFRTRG